MDFSQKFRPYDSIVILANCHFSGLKLNFFRGTVQLISPKFMEKSYYPIILIKGSMMSDFSIIFDKNQDQNIIMKIEEVENFYLDSPNRKI